MWLRAMETPHSLLPADGVMSLQPTTCPRSSHVHRKGPRPSVNRSLQEADAEDLPFADESFDMVVSTFGVMFTPDQERAASELLRVCRSRGKIGLANWTPDGFIGRLFKTVGRYMPPPGRSAATCSLGQP